MLMESDCSSLFTSLEALYGQVVMIQGFWAGHTLSLFSSILCQVIFLNLSSANQEWPGTHQSPYAWLWIHRRDNMFPYTSQWVPLHSATFMAESAQVLGFSFKPHSSLCATASGRQASDPFPDPLTPFSIPSPAPPASVNSYNEPLFLYSLSCTVVLQAWLTLSGTIVGYLINENK